MCSDSHARLHAAGIRVSLFIDADCAQIQAAYEGGARVIELHTGAYADAPTPAARQAELAKIRDAATFADGLGITVNAGHGLTVQNVGAIAQIEQIVELNIGHSIIAQAIFLGLPAAIAQMKEAMFRARSKNCTASTCGSLIFVKKNSQGNALWLFLFGLFLLAGLSRFRLPFIIIQTG